MSVGEIPETLLPTPAPASNLSACRRDNVLRFAIQLRPEFRETPATIAPSFGLRAFMFSFYLRFGDWRNCSFGAAKRARLN